MYTYHNTSGESMRVSRRKRRVAGDVMMDTDSRIEPRGVHIAIYTLSSLGHY